MAFKTRSIALLLAVAFGFAACDQKAEEGSDSGQLDSTLIQSGSEDAEPVMAFEEEIWDFGRINEGEIVKHKFKFTNTGNETLVISNCSASCGCTTPECPKQPIEPGETGVIAIRFNSKGRLNSQTKNITVIANTVPPENVITIKGFVMAQ